MIARRFAVFTLSAAIGYGIALHEFPKQHPAMAATAVGVQVAR